MAARSNVRSTLCAAARCTRAGLLVSAALLLAACEGDPAAPGPRTISATFQLQVVARAPLPALLSSRFEYRLEVIAGTLRLASDSAFHRKIEYRTTERGVSRASVEADSGRYTLKGESLLLNKADGSTDSGTLSGPALTVVTSTGVTWDFRQ